MITKELYGRQVKVLFTDDDTKPICVFNVRANPRGLALEEEMLKWIYPRYNVFVIEHDGKQFEYPGLKFLQDYVTNNDVKVPILYIHTKGAVMVREESAKVRNVWKKEFGDNMAKYVQIVNVAEPTIATPYSGWAKDPNPNYKGEYPVSWFNGWMVNPAGAKLIDVPISEDRYLYETCLYKGIHIVGTRFSDVWLNTDKMKDMYNDIMKNF